MIEDNIMLLNVIQYHQSCELNRHFAAFHIGKINFYCTSKKIVYRTKLLDFEVKRCNCINCPLGHFSPLQISQLELILVFGWRARVGLKQQQNIFNSGTYTQTAFRYPYNIDHSMNG